MLQEAGSVAQWIEHQTLNTWMTPGVGSSPTGAKIFVSLLVPLGKALYSNCSVVRRSRKAVGPVYMYLNINTSVHVKERHRLFVKCRGSSRYCWLYFKTTLIYSRFQSMGQGRLWPVWVPWPLGSKWNVGQYHRRRSATSLFYHVRHASMCEPKLALPDQVKSTLFSLFSN